MFSKLSGCGGRFFFRSIVPVVVCDDFFVVRVCRGFHSVKLEYRNRAAEL